jgi:hypothetical protein
VSDVNKLMTDAQKQLEEHVEWLAGEIDKLPTDVALAAAKAMLVTQAKQIRLRVVRVDQGRTSIVWDYPDELLLWLRAPGTPQHLRDTLAGGHLVSPDTPASSFRRE